MWALEAKVIPHAMQRYPTVGDWMEGHFGQPHTIHISSLNNEDYEFLILFHELIEFWLCRKRGITQELVDSWDMQFEGNDPGADPRAPYHHEHMYATYLEQLMGHELGVDWREYDKRCTECA